MSDLRTRISDAVLSLGGFCRGDANEVADAVIRELGLKHYCRECGGWGPFDE